MGNCCAQSESDHKANPNDVINRRLQQEAKEFKNLMQIFLLGPGDSGKTTILKQMKKIYGAVTEHDRSGITVLLHEAILTYMNVLSNQSIQLQRSYKLETDVDKSLYELRDEFIAHKQKLVVTQEIAEKIERLWNDKGLKRTLEYRSLYQLPDNVGYYLDKVREIASEGYVPSFDDYIRFRFRTTGFASERFESEIEQKKYIVELTDVGGQRSERKKWLTLDTSRINAVLYVLAISEYDMMLFEDNKVKRLDEAFDLFVEVMKTGFIIGKTCVIFFNKYDLFQEKIKTSPIREFFTDFPEDLDDQNPNIVCDWLFARFQAVYDQYRKQEPDAPKSEIHYHCTTALDTNLMEGLLKDIQLDLIRNKLAIAGYL